MTATKPCVTPVSLAATIDECEPRRWTCGRGRLVASVVPSLLLGVVACGGVVPADETQRHDGATPAARYAADGGGPRPESGSESRMDAAPASSDSNVTDA